jgi:hypothetical protein
METFRQIVQSLIAVDSIWSVVLRGGLWLLISLVIIVSTDAPNPQRSMRSLKANLGFLLLFLVLSGGLIYMLFGFTKNPTPKQTDVYSQGT